jgi:hypothetical protein
MTENTVLTITVRPEDYEVLVLLEDRCRQWDQTGFISHLISQYEQHITHSSTTTRSETNGQDC